MTGPLTQARLQAGPENPERWGSGSGDHVDNVIEDRRAHRALLANIRHELRTPINAIIGYSEMLLEDAHDTGLEALVPDLERIQLAGNQLAGLVNQVLDPAKIESGKLDVDLETVGANIRYAMLTPINTIIGYAEMLLEDIADQDREDTAADLEKINSAAHRFLALINDIVSFSNTQASADLQDMASAGTSAMIQDVVKTIRSLEDEDASSNRAGHGAVLIVDDNDINRDVLTRRLEREGHVVAAAANGREALEMVRARAFDLVLLDVMMPEMNGYQVLQRLKADAGLRDIPVIMISALDEVDSVVRCIELGAEDYLPKPFNPVLLKARIGASLEKKRLRDVEVDYMRNAARVTSAAAAVESGEFEPQQLDEVAGRPDQLGQLARVFQRMAREVQAREARLKAQVQELRIQIDEVKREREVAEITDSDYFRELQAKARKLRSG